MKHPLRKIVDHRDETTLAASLRRRRFRLFLSLVTPLPKPVTILDLGGEQRFWEVMGLVANDDYQIVILNVYPLEIEHHNLRSVVGDATDLHDYADQEFDFAFSNSVIEHLGSYERQQHMANEVQRVSKHYFVQTPNRYFPLEPHFLVPFFQFFPLSLQISLMQRFNLGWYKKIPGKEEALQQLRSHRLLTEQEMRALFPQGGLYRERILGLTKSFIAYGSGRSI